MFSLKHARVVSHLAVIILEKISPVKTFCQRKLGRSLDFLSYVKLTPIPWEISFCEPIPGDFRPKLPHKSCPQTNGPIYISFGPFVGYISPFARWQLKKAAPRTSL